MPISKKEFKEGNFTVLRGRAFEILEFLKTNKDKAYISREIAVVLKTNQVSVTPILKKLAEGGLIERRAPYYTLADENTKVIREEPEEKPKKAPVKTEPEPVKEAAEEEEFEAYDEDDEGEPQPYVEPQ